MELQGLHPPLRLEQQALGPPTPQQEPVQAVPVLGQVSRAEVMQSHQQQGQGKEQAPLVRVLVQATLLVQQAQQVL